MPLNTWITPPTWGRTFECRGRLLTRNMSEGRIRRPDGMTAGSRLPEVATEVEGVLDTTGTNAVVVVVVEEEEATKEAPATAEVTIEVVAVEAAGGTTEATTTAVAMTAAAVTTEAEVTTAAAAEGTMVHHQVGGMVEEREKEREEAEVGIEVTTAVRTVGIVRVDVVAAGGTTGDPLLMAAIRRPRAEVVAAAGRGIVPGRLLRWRRVSFGWRGRCPWAGIRSRSRTCRRT